MEMLPWWTPRRLVQEALNEIYREERERLGCSPTDIDGTTFQISDYSFNPQHEFIKLRGDPPIGTRKPLTKKEKARRRKKRLAAKKAKKTDA